MLLHAAGWFACLTSLSQGEDTSSDGKGLNTCRCLEWSGLDEHITAGKLIYTPPGSKTSYQYPSDYGTPTCKAHDKSLPPFCDRPSPPDWCFQKWCFVDKQQCTGVQLYDSSYWPGKTHYSYDTCGSANSFTLWYENGLSAGGGGKLLDILEGYLWSSRDFLEKAYIQYSSQQLTHECEYSTMCPCYECYENEAWQKQKIDLGDTGGYIQKDISGNLRRIVSCLISGVSQTYNKIAAKESDSGRRVGWMYFGDQATGSVSWWPNVDWCADSYDPRLRPWYSAASTGPKDVVIVVDVSGSMTKQNRYELAKEATESLLDTLEWKDYANIILFNQGISAQFSSNMVPVDSCKRMEMKAWLRMQKWNEGGTNFVVAMNRAFDVIRDSVKAGETSMCQKAILFLTDGKAEFSDDDFASMQVLSKRYDTSIFTYALGSGSDKTVTKKLACQNRGIFYPIPDGGDLKHIMSQYYSFFASGQEVCQSAFTAYTDLVTGSELWPACLPMYDRSSSQSKLLGVTCMDINIIADPSALKNQEGWADFACKMSDMTKKCRPMHLTACHLERMRREYSHESVCDVSQSTTSCPCLDQACSDDEDWLDEQGYFCDTWIGDDCTKAQEQWQYSWEGTQAVLQKCRKSCGLCQVLDPCPYNNSSPCQGHTFSNAASARCRACRTDKVSGVGIEGHPMCCPETGNCKSGARGCAISQDGQQTTPGSQDASVSIVAPSLTIFLCSLISLVQAST